MGNVVRASTAIATGGLSEIVGAGKKISGEDKAKKKKEAAARVIADAKNRSVNKKMALLQEENVDLLNTTREQDRMNLL